MIRLTLTMAALLLVVPSIAFADTAAVIGTTQSEQISEAERTEAVDAVSRALAADGITVMSARDAQLRMIGDPLATCSEVGCVDQVARHLGTDFVALVTVWARRESNVVSSVTVTLVNAEAHTFGGEGDVERLGSIVAASNTAVFEARQRQSSGTLGFLRIRTTPNGASVSCDGEALGQTPFFRGMAPGHHTIVVSQTGYAPETREVEVQLHQETAVDLTLRATGDDGVIDPAGPLDDEEVSRASAWNYVVGGALVLGAVPMLASSLSTLATNGNALDDGSTVRFGAQSGLLLGLGIASIVGGTIFCLAQPLRYNVTVSATEARLTLAGSF